MSDPSIDDIRKILVADGIPESKITFSALLKRLNIERDRQPSAADRGENSAFINSDGSVVGLEDLSAGNSISAEAGKVNEACDSIGIKEIYDRLGKGVYGPRSGDEIQISCPNPAHPDANPSASMNVAKDLFYCYRCCQKGTNKYAVAAYAWGYPVPIGEKFWEVKKRLAEELRGVVYGIPTRSTPQSSVLGADVVPDVDAFEKKVEEQKRATLIRLEGDHRARQQRASGLFTPPSFISDLETELADPEPEVEWTIDKLHSVGGNTTITAGFKVGRTTFMANLVRALADQEPFLGSHDVRSLNGRIAYWNFEVEQVQMKRMFRELGIGKPSSIWHLSLRGHSLNLLDDAAFAWALAEMKRQEIEVWVIDPFSGAYFGDENDNSQINAFTKRLDEFKLEAGIKDLFMPVHTGRYVEEGKERARGGAKLDDWADSRWVLAKHAETGDRYFKAEGRRIAQDERELQFTRDDNRLSYSTFNGTRRQKSGDVLQREVRAYIDTNPGCSQRDIEASISGNSGAIRAAIKRLIASFDIETTPGPRNATLHYACGATPARIQTASY